MSKTHDFPIIFNIGGSSRHDVILINPGHSIEDISKQVESLVASSVNCQEPLAKYKKKGSPEKVSTIKVRWSSEGRDSRLFPKSTILTEDNSEAILTLVSLNGGKDVLEVETEGGSSEEEGKPEELADRTK